MPVQDAKGLALSSLIAGLMSVMLLLFIFTSAGMLPLTVAAFPRYSGWA